MIATIAEVFFFLSDLSDHSGRSDHMETRLKSKIPILHMQTIFLKIKNVIPLRVEC